MFGFANSVSVANSISVVLELAQNGHYWFARLINVRWKRHFHVRRRRLHLQQICA